MCFLCSNTASLATDGISLLLWLPGSSKLNYLLNTSNYIGLNFKYDDFSISFNIFKQSSTTILIVLLYLLCCHCLPFWLLEQKAIDCVAYRHQTFISHCPGSWKPEIRGPSLASSCEGPLPGVQMAVSLLCPSMRQGQRDLVSPSFTRTHVPLPKAPPS